jgi:phenylalanyl-tRNA synthetase beta subunit
VTYAGVPEDAERPREVRRIAAAVCATKAGYAQGRSVLDSLLAELKLDGGEYRKADNPSALPGRAAEVVRDGEVIAEVFELHPRALEMWRIGNPVVLLSLTLGDVEYH